VPLPGGDVTIRRPPEETVPALSAMIKSQPRPQQLYSLRALEEEQALDFTAAEADWKLYLESSPAKAEAQLALADFYHRRHRPLDEVSALSALGRMPQLPAEKLTAPADQSSWKAFERIFQVIHSQALANSVAVEQYKVWIQRYPQEPAVYARYFEFLLVQRDFNAAQNLIAGYRSRFPEDEVFLTKARALLAYKQGAVEQGLAVYERSFQPLWPDELLKNYFDLLAETHNLRHFADRARKALEQDPDDLDAASRIFHYHRQAGNLDAAQQSLTVYRLKKESRGAPWTAKELYTFAQLLERAQRYPEAARYYFALYNCADKKAPEQALVGLARILLEAPEQQIRFGAADLSMYSNIATMDTGPGYLNGILSLILNGTAPDEQYSKEEGRAVVYFHRARAGEMVALLDRRFPASEARPGLHARLIDSYSTYGQDDAVIRLGQEFLAAFPNAEERTEVSLRVADVYELRNNTKEEFALYDVLLKELASKAEGIPLGDDVPGAARSLPAAVDDEYHDPGHREEMESQREDDDGNSSESDDDKDRPGDQGKAAKQAFSLSSQAAGKKGGARSPEYQRVLDRYLARLAQQHAVPEALTVLRRELDRNPDDSGLYERLAVFLEQNGLGTEQEAIYKRAIQKFSGTGWYGRLASLYLRQERQDDFQRLTWQVAEIFSGTELHDYIEQVRTPDRLTLAIEQYAHRRFPHNMVFVRELLNWYTSHNQSAEWEALLRQYWYEDQSMRNMFFEYLSRTGRLEAELQQLKPQTADHRGISPWPGIAREKPAAARFVAEAELWRSHFEEAAPALGAVAGLYPADAAVGREASSVYRSLAYFNPGNTAKAVRIEVNLQRANPLNRDTLARIGDIYADRAQFAQAAPYWNRMPLTEPGNPDAYEEAATVFWDYYMFDDALRLLHSGRARLNDEKLYSYQAGAIYENKRDYSRAIHEYVKGAVQGTAESPSYKRLVQLASRHATAALVDAATALSLSGTGFNIQAIRLRADVLQARSRTRELAPLLDSLVKRVEATELLEQMDSLALQRGLNDVHCRILERQVALSSDPVRKMQLQYALASFYEGHKNLTAAEQNIESVYRENPRILGVVRSTVDFYWRNKQPRRAIQVLQKAAADAYPELRTSLNYEAARKMTETGEYGPARAILAGLLEQTPYNGEYLAAIADTYARAGDNAGLRDFYITQIASFRQANLAVAERKSRIAALRRGLIPALTATRDYAGAVDQYIELINGYPEDESITSEAVLYAQRHQRTSQILAFYKKTVTDSPRDPRWMVVLGRLETAAEDHAAAIQAYSQAITIRPDRPDLIIARANLEERLLRFDEAAADYATLYERTYHDPMWMEKEAEVRARQNKPELAVKALEAARIDGGPKSPSAYFEVAERLERWGLLSEARTEVEKGVAAAGSDLLAGWENHSGARLYVRLSTRLRMQEAAFNRLESAVNDASALPLWSRDAGKKGLDAITDKEWRANVLHQRVNAARAGMAACMVEMGSAVRQYFTPEEKVEFLRLVEKKNSQMNRQDALTYLLPLAEKAELAELQARLMFEALQAPPFSDRFGRYSSSSAIGDFAEFQIRRLRLPELGQQLEQLASGQRNGCTDHQVECLTRAADVYHLANKPEDELRVLDAIGRWDVQRPEQRQRHFELLLARSPQTLVEWASRSDERGNQSAEFLLAHADARLARQAIDSRGATERAVWKPAYTALAGLYFNDSSPQVKAAFQRALDDRSIGQRLKSGGDPDRAITGETWFYYASRYGEYLKMARNGEAEDFLPASLEHAPADAGAYLDVADTFEQYGDWTHAVEDYQHGLELSPSRVDAHYCLAGIYWKQNQKEAALLELRQALANLKKKVGRNLENASEMRDFREDYFAIAAQIKKMGVWPQFSSDLTGILHDYVKINDYYSSLWPMVSAAAGRDQRMATSLILELSREANGPREEIAFLERFAGAEFKSKLQTEPILSRMVEIMRNPSFVTQSGGEDYIRYNREELEMDWLESLLIARQYDRLRDEMRVIAKSSSDANREALFSIQLRLAAATGNLDSALAAFKATPEQSPSGEVLRAIADKMQQAGDKRSAQKILEFVYQREIENHQLTVANMLGLAEIRIDQGDLPTGLDLLRRMSLVAGAPFEAQDPAAALLVRTGHSGEAIPFLQELVTAMPWNAEYRLRLAQAQTAAGRDVQSAHKDLAAIAGDTRIAYATRVAAAKGFTGSGRLDLGSRELNLLATGGAPAASEADQPFFFAARLKAAEHLNGAARIALLGHALDEYPSADIVRLPLLRASMNAGEYHQAIAAMKPFLHNHWLQVNSWSGYYYNPDLDDQDDSDEDSAAEENEDVADQGAEFAPDLSKLPAAERAEVSEQLGLAFQKLGALDEALFSFSQATGMHPSPAVAKRIKAEMRAVKGVLQERRANRQRQPSIHDDLEQDAVVRPRLASNKPQTNGDAIHGGHQ
jgi:predicted Zn-dependent protease